MIPVANDYNGMMIRSYANNKGNFVHDIEKIIKETLNLNNHYCFVEKKTEYYKCMWDFDYKDKLDEWCKTNHEEITSKIINSIDFVLDNMFDKIDRKYIYCIKNKGLGVHVYYPNILVNTETHQEIYHNIIEHINTICNDCEYIIDNVTDILDLSTCASNGMRVIYNVYKDAYYYPCVKKSTFEIPENKAEQIRLTLINTTEKNLILVKNGCSYERKNNNEKPLLNNKKVLIEDDSDDEKPVLINKKVSKVLIEDSDGENNNIKNFKNDKKFIKKHKKFTTKNNIDTDFDEPEKIKKTLTDLNMVEIKKLLSIVQADNQTYNSWIKIGITLFSISSDEDMFKIWCIWSSFNYKADIAVLKDKWKNFTRTIGPNEWGLFNLRKYVKENYPKEYKIYFNNHVFEKTKAMVFDGTQAEVSKFFYRLKPDSYIFQNGIWYYLNSNNIWKVMHPYEYSKIGNDLYNTICCELKELKEHLNVENNVSNNKTNEEKNINKIKDDLTDNVKINDVKINDVKINDVKINDNLPNDIKINDNLPNEEKNINLPNDIKINDNLPNDIRIKNTLQNNIKIKDDSPKNNKLSDEEIKMNKLIDTINNFKRRISCRTFLNDTMYFFSFLYFREHIDFDRNKNILPFDNCLYDLKDHKFRIIKPNDYVSMTTGYNWTEPKIEDIELAKDLLLKIQPNKDYRNCLLDILCSGLNGLVTQSFIFYTGGGANGKSTINDIMLAGMGKFGAVFNAGVLCSIIKSGGANSDVANMHLKRYLIGKEPPEKLTYCKSTIKDLTGGKIVNARNLYSPNDQTEINGTFGCESNNNPLFDGSITYAEVRRVKLIKFKSRFTMDENEVNNEKFIFKANDFYVQDEFHQKIKFAFLTLLFEHNKLIFKGQITIPACVKQDTNELLLKANEFLVWFDSEFEFINDPTVKDFTTIRGICEELRKSNFYNSLSAKQRNELIEKNIKDMFINHPLYSVYFKSNIDTTFENERIRGINCILGCKRKIHDYF